MTLQTQAMSNNAHKCCRWPFTECDWPGGYGQCDLADMSDIIIT